MLKALVEEREARVRVDLRSTEDCGFSSGFDWAARSLLIAIGVFLAWYTWGHWGSVTIDCGRELYVPAAILKGKLLYRDLWYPYGPFTPYLQALLFEIFGTYLNVLYVLGLATTLVNLLLLFALARRFVPTMAAVVVGCVFLIQGFAPSIFNYIFPYSYAAVIGSCLANACIYFVVRHLFRDRGRNLLFAGLMAGFALLCKQEFGVTCYALIALTILLDGFDRRSAWVGFLGGLELLPGLVLNLAVYGWFFWRLSPAFILFENFEATPHSYFMQRFGAKWVAQVGLRFVPQELLLTAIGAIGSLAIWYSAAALLRDSLRRWWILPAASGAGCLMLLSIDGSPAIAKIISLHTRPLSNGLFLIVIFPLGMFWLSMALLIWTIAQMLRNGPSRHQLALTAFAFYAIILGVRIMVRVVPDGYAIFYNMPLFLVFIYWLCVVVDWPLRRLEARPRNSIMAALLSLEVMVFAAVRLPQPEKLPARLVTNMGAIYTQPAEASIFPQAIAFIRRQKTLGKRVAILPEVASLYAFSGATSPTRWYEITPGQLGPEQQQKLIAEMEVKQPDFVLLSNRSTYEYEVPYFGIDYEKAFYRWMESRYAVVGEFGHFERRPGAPFAMLIYQRRRR
ncbi:MAG: glycosyltransferase family 39 protein [Candidatus Binataceae bacterium]|nr:glycosyltransferase family 39 protein [Candidatus Binataceae bacterium]